MHDYFSAWLANVNVRLTGDVAESRWNAVEALVQWVTESNAVGLSAAAVTIESLTEKQRQEMAGVLQRGDPSFPMIGNQAELQVLAASAIVQLFENEGSATDVAALGVATGTFGDRDPEATPELTSLVENYLSQRAVSIRRVRESRPTVAFTSGHAGAMTRLHNEISGALEQDDHKTTMKILDRALSSLTGHVKRVAETAFSDHNRLSLYQTALSEENDILWWVIGGYSRDLRKPRDQASAAELTLPSARELASLVVVGVPPAASIEYLRHAVSPAKEEASQQLAVMEAIAATAPEWRASAMPMLQSEADRLFPVLAGLRMMGEVADDGELNQTLRDRTGLDGVFAAAPEEIGVHFLRELSLAKHLADFDSPQE